MPLCGPWSPPLALWPLTSTPSVLLSTHCVPSKSPGVKPVAVKVKMHLFPGPFVQDCHYAGCDQATKFSSKINRPPPSHPLHYVYPQGDAPPGRVSSLFHFTPSLAEDLLPVYSLFNTPSFVYSFFLVLRYHACALLFLIALTHFFSSSSSTFPFSLLLYRHASLFPSHLFPSLLSLIFCLSISSLIFFPPSISLSVWPRHPVVWKLAHPGSAPEALRTAPWVMGIVYSH